MAGTQLRGVRRGRGRTYAPLHPSPFQPVLGCFGLTKPPSPRPRRTVRRTVPAAGRGDDFRRSHGPCFRGVLNTPVKGAGASRPAAEGALGVAGAEQRPDGEAGEAREEVEVAGVGEAGAALPVAPSGRGDAKTGGGGGNRVTAIAPPTCQRFRKVGLAAAGGRRGIRIGKREGTHSMSGYGSGSGLAPAGREGGGTRNAGSGNGPATQGGRGGGSLLERIEVDGLVIALSIRESGYGIHATRQAESAGSGGFSELLLVKPDVRISRIRLSCKYFVIGAQVQGLGDVGSGSSLSGDGIFFGFGG